MIYEEISPVIETDYNALTEIHIIFMYLQFCDLFFLH